MSNIISVTSGSIDKLASEQVNEVLPGLSKKSYGFVIGNPGAGKGYFFLSLAYELTTNIKLLGLSKQSTPIKVLYWPIEDGVNIVAKRIKKHINGINSETAQLIESNFSLYDSLDPICSKRNEATITKLIDSNRNELITAASDYDLLIIDTIREASGSCHEVEDDINIKVSLQDVARNADVAILVSHHPTKDIMRKKEILTTVSGSGLSVTQANSRYSIFIDTVEVKKEKNTQISHLKHNNVEQEDVLLHKQVNWDSSSLMFMDNEILKAFKSNTYVKKPNQFSNSGENKDEVPYPIEIEDEHIPQPISVVEELVPQSINLDDVLTSDESVTRQEERSAVDNNTLEEYSLFLAQQKK